MVYKQWGLHYLPSLQCLLWIFYRKAECCWFHSHKINHFRASHSKWGQDRSKIITVGAKSSSALQIFALFESRFSLKFPKYPTFLWLIHVERQNTIAINQQFFTLFPPNCLQYLQAKFRPGNSHLFPPHIGLLGEITDCSTNLILRNPDNVQFSPLLFLDKHPTTLTFIYSRRSSSSAL